MEVATTCSTWCDHEPKFSNSFTDGLGGGTHATTSSDIYNDFYIPKGILAVFMRHARTDICSTGATVIGNIWYAVNILLILNVDILVRAMTRDETRCPDAETFIPERFLDAEGMLTDDKVDFVFGFGRRVCPGRQLCVTH